MELDEHGLRPYMLELDYLADSCRQPAIAYRMLLGQPATDPIKYSHRVFGHLHSVLTAAAACSRVLWPSPKPGPGERTLPPAEARSQAAWRGGRGRAVRNALSLDPKELPTLQDRTLRNAIEHFDEWIDDMVRSGFTGNVVDRSIYFADLQVTSESPVKVMRWVDNETGVAHVGEAAVDVYRLAEELQLVGDRARGWLRQCPLPASATEVAKLA